MRLADSRNILTALAAVLMNACGPHAHIPPRGVVPIPGVATSGDSIDVLARGLAPVLYLQRDEVFPLSRVVAVVNPIDQTPVVQFHSINPIY